MPPKIYPTSSHIRVGVLLAPPPLQVLDLAPVDLFHMLSKGYLGPLSILPQPIKDVAIHKVEIFYIADEADTSLISTGNGSLLAPMTANMSIRITAPLSAPEVQPGQLSILVIPGPDPASKPSEACKSFIRAHAACGTTDIITVCTGIYPACYSGICDGRIVTGPRGIIPDLRSKFKAVKSFEDKRWSHCSLAKTDGSPHSKGMKAAHGERPAELWTAAGITNGHDCIAAYIKAHFNLELAEIVCRIADVGERSRDYDTGQVTEGMWWVSRILPATIKGFWRKD
ncbi:hypothetical protein PMZ80_009986 [Knufia obscura]|uniref:DJ-1/PfpI domain-containing protein n=2 Tax=Knufia TaxID=430999 RepID=A0AAN8IQH7_9EURO|nr:hypothetical protein PMZ80_009986 [Knufia obscura]KAK5956077.1 hypothetical protein OHC33_002650 [Knufia fluminis]